MNKQLRIIFMGTPEFAVASLTMLAENDINVVAVITAPDKPKGRGKKLSLSPVKEYAQENNLPVLQPKNLKSPEFQQELRSFQADLQIVVAFRMLPEAVWNMPPLGTFNLHASLLPQYRGAAPINWAIINGESKTGVTTFFLKHEIDTGEIIFQEEEPIEPQDNVGTLYDRLMKKGAELVLKTVLAVQSGDYPQLPQTRQGELKPAPKIFKETCQIDWSKSTHEIDNFVRGLSPYPAAWTQYQGKTFKIYDVESSKEISQMNIGDWKQVDKKIVVRTGDGTIVLKELQAEGKKRMKTEDFLRGNSL